jgi:hypothetical protein
VNRAERALRMLVAIGGAALGLVCGHLLDYRLVVPAGDRAALLHQSGHAYLPYAIVGSLCVAVLAGLAAGRLGYLRGTGLGGGALSRRALAARLVVLQLVSFLALEAGERVAAGGTIADLAGPLLWLGLALQVGAAIAVSGLLGLIHRAGQQVGRLLARRARPATSRSVRLPIGLTVAPVRDPFIDARPARGPPKILLVAS